MPHQLRSLVALCALVVAAACGGRVPAPAGGPGGAVPAQAVERFLQLAAEKSYVQMGWIFGTAAEGPIARRWPLPEVEKRMYAIAGVLDHDSFVVGQGTPVPGSVGGSQRFTVRLRKGQRAFEVPVTVVRGPAERWYVEQVDVQAVTGQD